MAKITARPSPPRPASRSLRLPLCWLPGRPLLTRCRPGAQYCGHGALAGLPAQRLTLHDHRGSLPRAVQAAAPAGPAPRPRGRILSMGPAAHPMASAIYRCWGPPAPRPPTPPPPAPPPPPLPAHQAHRLEHRPLRPRPLVQELRDLPVEALVRRPVPGLGHKELDLPEGAAVQDGLGRGPVAPGHEHDPLGYGVDETHVTQEVRAGHGRHPLVGQRESHRLAVALKAPQVVERGDGKSGAPRCDSRRRSAC